MRIIGGTYRGKKIITPTSDHIRPTTDRMRETLFNMLEHGAGTGVRNSSVLDLYCGTGALGIEALSRGAEYITFVDNHKSSLNISRKNATAIKKDDKSEFLNLDASKLNSLKKQYDIIFIDPPYKKGLIEPTLHNVISGSLLRQGGVCVIEYSANEEIDIPPEFEEIKKRKMGEATFSILTLLSSTK